MLNLSTDVASVQGEERSFQGDKVLRPVSESGLQDDWPEITSEQRAEVEKLRRALAEAKVLDMVVEEKEQTLRALESERKVLEKATLEIVAAVRSVATRQPKDKKIPNVPASPKTEENQPEPKSDKVQDIDAASEVTDDDMSLLDEALFVTMSHPADLHNVKDPGSKLSLQSEPNMSLLENNEKKPEHHQSSLKLHKNFVSRNIALGGDARYFCALTPAESFRLERLLEVPLEDEGEEFSGAANNLLNENSDEDDPEITDVKSVRDIVAEMKSTAPIAFSFCPEEVKELASIQVKLAQLVPEVELRQKLYYAESEKIKVNDFNDQSSEKVTEPCEALVRKALLAAGNPEIAFSIQNQQLQKIEDRLERLRSLPIFEKVDSDDL